jgi:predicted HTH transcriptional regulator
MSRIPLGEAESQCLEFKAADALRSPESIAKSVVGLLNAQGGELWIGLREENERAVSLESVPDAEAACRSLRDHLIDTVEPAPSEREISIKPVTHDSGARLVLLRATPGGRGP